MKNWKSFLLGFFIGAIVTIGILAIVGMYSQKSHFTWFNEPGESIDLSELRVVDVIKENAAITYGKRVGDLKYNSNQMYLLYNSVGHTYFDNEIIEVPDTLEIVQLGTYKYTDKYGESIVIPIVGRVKTNKKKHRELGGYYSADMPEFEKNAITMVAYSTESTFPTISLKNNMARPVTSVSYRVIYYDMSGNMLDYKDFTMESPIDSHMVRECNIDRFGGYEAYYYKSKKKFSSGKPYKVSYELQSYVVER